MGVSSIECRTAHSCFDGTERVHVETGFGARSSFEGSADFFASTFLRFETVNELWALSAVLGALVTMEVRKRKPKYTIVESLFVNDIINVVAGSQTCEEPF